MTPKFTQRNSSATAMKVQTSSDLKPKNPRKKTETISNESMNLGRGGTRKYIVDKKIGDKVVYTTPYERTSETGTKTTKKRLIGGRTVEKSNTKNTYAKGIKTDVMRNVSLSNKRPVDKETYNQESESKKYNVSTKVIKDKQGNIVRSKKVVKSGTNKPVVTRTKG